MLSTIVIVSDYLDVGAYVILIALFVIFIAILYAKEIKRDLWAVKMSSSELKSFKDSKNSSLKSATECIENIIVAVQDMSKNNVGALIILADNNMPTAVLESGVLINSEISSEIIESIFFPKTPLHDGAMIIKSKEIKYAGCFLPLSQKLNIPKDLGTRHRAGIGITETINVTSIIVSEETGIISIAKGGKITRYADSETLKEVLNAYYKLELIAEK
jgi:diadenylate cyclase